LQTQEEVLERACLMGCLPIPVTAIQRMLHTKKWKKKKKENKTTNLLDWLQNNNTSIINKETMSDLIAELNSMAITPDITVDH